MNELGGVARSKTAATNHDMQGTADFKKIDHDLFTPALHAAPLTGILFRSFHIMHK
jgi:hypothetical protein